MSGADSLPSVWVSLLGPLRLVVDGAVVELPGPKRRAVLVLLALAEGRTVPTGDLLDALWPTELPESGRQALQTHVSRLRVNLGAAAPRLQTRPDGYRLALDDGLDLARARALLAAGRSAGSDDPSAALGQLRDAYALWRGPVLADLTDVGPIAAAAQGIARLKSEVTDALIAAAIAAGKASEIEELATEAHSADPLRETAVLLLMRARAATGRAPEALSVGREFRRRLADETGLDPSPALKDLEREIAGGAAGPPLGRASPPARPPTRLFGREAQVGTLHRLLAGERLVSLVGPGGVGKTRVAMEIAGRTERSIVLPLAPVTDPSTVAHALAAALNLRIVQGDVLTACASVLGDRPGLLIIDNCEHLLEPIRDTVTVLLASCPQLTVLTTSREPLGLTAEHTYRLAPLPLPGPQHDLVRVPSVAMFLDRAARIRAHSATPAELHLIADIVRRLDGMPLAIELAAGRLSSFSLADLQRRLDRALDLLGGGRPSTEARHRTLRATVEWSYNLLSEDEQRLFRHLSVFADGVDLDAAERLAAELGLSDDPGRVLAHLVDASMIIADFTTGTRYRLLDTLRAFGLDRLAAAGEEEAAASRLLRWAVELTGWIGVTLNSERESDADAVLRRELPNLRAAWRLARQREALDEAGAMVVSLFDAITYRDLVELRGWAEELAPDLELAGHPRATAVIGIAAEATYHRGDYAGAERRARHGLETADDAGRWYCKMALAVAVLARGAYAEVVEHSLAAATLRESRENFGIAALATAYAGDLDAARTLNDRGLAGAVSPAMLSWGTYVTAEIESLAGRSELAEDSYVRAIGLARGSGATFLVGVATVGLLALRARTGRVQDALRGYREVVDYFARTGNWTHLWVTLRNLAGLLRGLGEREAAGLIETAADRAPDAPAVDPAAGLPAGPAQSATPALGRTQVLDVARRAIEHALGQERSVVRS